MNARVKTIGLLAALAGAGLPAYGETILETFDDDALEPRFRRTADPGWSNVVSEGRLHMTKAAGTDGFSASRLYLQDEYLVGDFDVRVHAQAESAGIASVGLVVSHPRTGWVSFSDVFISSSGRINALCGTPANAQNGHSVGATQADLRIERTGQTLTLSYDIGSGWVELLSGTDPILADPVRVSLFHLEQSSGSTMARGASFDDWSITADEIAPVQYFEEDFADIGTATSAYWTDEVRDASGWGYSYSTADGLRVTEIDATELHSPSYGGSPWGEVWLRRPIPPFGDFTMTFDVYFDASGTNAAMAKLYVFCQSLLDDPAGSSSTVCLAGYNDAWYASRGEYYAFAASSGTEGPRTLPLSPTTASFRIARYGSSVEVRYNNVVFHTGPASALPFEEILLVLGHYAYDANSDGIQDSILGEIGISNLRIEGLNVDDDTDNDGLLNYEETYVYGTDPNFADTDADGLDDGDEIALRGAGACPDPLVFDTDGDGLSDGFEATTGISIFDPCVPNVSDAIVVEEVGDIAGWDVASVGAYDFVLDTTSTSIAVTDIDPLVVNGPGGTDWSRVVIERAIPTLGDFDLTASLSWNDYGDTNAAHRVFVYCFSGHDLVACVGYVRPFQQAPIYWGGDGGQVLAGGFPGTGGGSVRIVREGPTMAVYADEQRIFEGPAPEQLIDVICLRFDYYAYDDGIETSSFGRLAVSDLVISGEIIDTDEDGDGLLASEEAALGTDPLNADSDFDGIGDGAEAAIGSCTDPLDADSDDDGLLDGAEGALGVNPCDSDSDDDGLLDGAEIDVHGTDPNDPDSDDDGFGDGAEVATGCTDPLAADSDGDGLEDGDEIERGTNPCNAHSDADGLDDGAEVQIHLTDPLDPDSDADGLDDGVEVGLQDFGTCPNPNAPDSDGDGLSDGVEYAAGLDPCDADSDDDGLVDGLEAPNGTDPWVPDSDGDGLLDGTEVDLQGEGTCPSPAIADSDGDGLSDGAEVLTVGSDPCVADSDGDGVEDGDDPTPLDPGVTGEYAEEALRDLSETAATIPLDDIAAPNGNAAKGRRNALSNLLRNAAKSVGEGDYADAIEKLTAAHERMDGEPSPSDWLEPSTETVALADEIATMIGLLEFGP